MSFSDRGVEIAFTIVRHPEPKLRVEVSGIFSEDAFEARDRGIEIPLAELEHRVVVLILERHPLQHCSACGKPWELDSLGRDLTASEWKLIVEQSFPQRAGMLKAARIAKQLVAGFPFLKKEIGRELSLRSGRVLATPSTYYVVFSGRCNLACPFCTIYPRVEPSLSGEEVIRIIHEARALSGAGFNISLSGGEPTIFKHLYECLEAAQRLRVNFGFTTNGIALTRQNVQRILSYDPFNVNVSLESVDPSVNESLRPIENGTSRTLAAIEHLIAEKERIGSRVSIIVKSTIMEQNYRSLPALVRYFGRSSPVQIYFQPYVGKAGDAFWVRDKVDLRRVLNELISLRKAGYRVVGNDRQFDGFYEYLCDPPPDHIRRFDLHGQKRNCDVGLRTMFIEPSGDVYFCDYLKPPLGNIREKSLTEIYYGTSAGGQRKTMIHCNIDCQQTCKRPVPLLSRARAFLRMG